jgi:hypothetical protein
MQLAQMHQMKQVIPSKYLPLEHQPKLGVYLLNVNTEDQARNDILFAHFNPKQRLLVTAGSHYVANIWDFRSDDYQNFAPLSSLPHIKGS